MEEKYRRGFEEVRKFIWRIFYLAGDIANLILRLIIIMGAIISFILLAKLFPETFVRLFNFTFPIFNVLFKIFLFVIKILIAVILAYIFMRFGLWYYDLIKKSKERSKKKKEKFLEELTDKIAKKIKRKK